MKSPIISTTLLSFGMLLASCASVDRTDLYRSYFDEPIRSEKAELSYRIEGATHVITVSGDEYWMGYHYGEKAAELGVESMYGEVMANAAAMLADDVPAEYRGLVTVKLVKRLLLDGWERMEPFVPDYMMRMLKGFSDGSGIALNDVYAMHAIPDFTETSCSALWATGDATTDGATLQIRVLDYIMGLGIQKYPTVVFMRFETGHTVANIGWLGLLGVISGMNDAGLAVSEMGYGNPDGENFHGIPMPFLLLDVLRWCATPGEAEGVVRSNPRTNSYVYIVGSAADGGTVFVTDAYEVQTFGPGDGEAPVPQLDDMLQAGHYQDRMNALVAERHGSISAEWLRDEFIPQIAMDSNLQSVVYDLDNLTFSVANAADGRRRAADQPYTEFSFPPPVSRSGVR